MHTQNNMEAQLWEYIDGLSSVDERKTIKGLIDSNLEWRRKHEELLEFNTSLHKNIDLDAPSMRFTRNVMEEISRYQIAPSAKSYIIYGIAGFFLTLILGFLVYAIAQIDWTIQSSTNAIPFDLSKIDTSRILSNKYVNAFMILNIVLGLMLLDQYLTHKRKSWKKENS